MGAMIKINGGDVPFRVGFRAIKNFQLKTKKSLDELGSASMEDLLVLYTECFRAGQRKETGKEPTITQEQVEDWLDQTNGFEILRLCGEELAEQLKALNEVFSGDEEKKTEGSGND